MNTLREELTKALGEEATRAAQIQSKGMAEGKLTPDERDVITRELARLFGVEEVINYEV